MIISLGGETMKKALISSLMILVFIVPALKGYAGQQNPAPKAYLLVLETMDYNSTLRKGIQYFFSDVLKKGDSLLLWTSQRLYNLSKYSVAGMNKQVIDKTIAVIKKDTELNKQIWNRDRNKRALKDIKDTYEKKILKCTEILKNFKGKKNIVMMYQIRYGYDYSESFTKYSQPVKVGDQYKMTFNEAPVIEALKSSGANFHFLYLDFKKGRPNANNSYDVEKVYKNLAKESNGFYLTTKKPLTFFKKMLEAIQ